MESETEKIYKKQLRKIPKEVRDFILSDSWDNDASEIGLLYKLSPQELESFKQEVSLVLVGLVHPDAFRETLEQEVVSNKSILEEIVKSVEEKIFAPIRPALVAFFEKENETEQAETPTVLSIPDVPPVSPVLPVPSVPPVPRMPDIAPDNLPTAEELEPLIPPLPPKNTNIKNETPSHPFEEQMKKVFTAGQQSMGELSIEPPAPQTTPPPAPPRPSFVDPYREPIE